MSKNNIKLIKTEGVQLKADYDKMMQDKLPKILDGICKNMKRIQKNLLKITDDNISFDDLILKFDIDTPKEMQPNPNYLLRTLLEDPFRNTLDTLKSKDIKIQTSLYHILFESDQLTKRNRTLISKFILPIFSNYVYTAISILNEFTRYRVKHPKRELIKILSLFFHPKYLKGVDL